MPGLVPGIQLSTNADARCTMDPGHEARDDTLHEDHPRSRCRRADTLADAQRRHFLRQDDDQRGRGGDRRRARGQAGDRLRLHLQWALRAVGDHPRAAGAAHSRSRSRKAQGRGSRHARSGCRLGRHDEQREAGRPRRPCASRPALSTWPCGMRRRRSWASRCGAFFRNATTAAGSTSACSSIPAAATTTPARRNRACRTRCASAGISATA